MAPPTFPSRSDDTFVALTWSQLLPNPHATFSAITGDGGHGMDWERLTALWPALVIALGMFLLRKFTKQYVFPPLGKALGVKKGCSMRKFSYQMWLFLFYTASTTYGFSVLRNKPYIAFPLGEKETMHTFINHPDTPVDPAVELYYIYQTGFYLSEFVAIFLEDRRKDFLEYVIHHLSTLVLVSLSYANYDHRVGSHILLLHDISDVFLCFTKSFHYVGLHLFVNTGFALFAASFAFLRLYCFPIILRGLFLTAALTRFSTHSFWVTCGLLVVLQVLHVYWFGLVMRIIWRLTTGVKGDVRSDDEEGDAPSRNRSAQAGVGKKVLASATTNGASCNGIKAKRL